MIEGLKPYPAYRATGDRWLTHFPSTWDRVRIKHLLREIDRRTQTGEEPLLSMRRNHGLVPLSQFSDKVAEPKALLAYKLVEPGELVVNRMQAGNGLVFVARIPGLISPDYAIFRPVREVNLDYLELLFRSYPMRAKFRSESTGLGTGTAGFLRLYGDSLGAIEIGLPSPDEQSQIVRFLGYADRQIRRGIQAKKRLITLLNEENQRIIQNAVTSGLDTTVRYKASGVEWIGDLPEHWEVVPLRRRWTVTDCKHLTVPFVEDGIPLASVREVQAFDLDLTNANSTTREWYENLIEGGRRPHRGDLIYCRNVSVGAAAVVNCEADFAMGQDVCLIRSSSQNQRFLNYFLHSPSMDRQLSLLLVGSTFDRINVADIKALTVVVPPRPEQDAIVGHLDVAQRDVKWAIAAASREVGLLKEYQLRLVADIVTGQIDVREAAAHLTAVPPPSEDEGLLADDATESDAAECDDPEKEVGA